MSCVNNNDLFLERAEEGGARSHWRHSNRNGCCLEGSKSSFTSTIIAHISFGGILDKLHKTSVGHLDDWIVTMTKHMTHNKIFAHFFIVSPYYDVLLLPLRLLSDCGCLHAFTTLLILLLSLPPSPLAQKTHVMISAKPTIYVVGRQNHCPGYLPAR